MPSLQVDGEEVARIDDTLAAKLKELSGMHGVGRQHDPARFQRAIKFQMPSRVLPTVKFNIELEFEGVFK